MSDRNATKRQQPRDVRVRDPATGVSLDYETYSIVRHDPAGWPAALRAWVSIRRKMGERFNVYGLWRLLGRKNPARQEGSRAAGEAVALRMTKTERQERARRGANALFHGTPDAYDPGRARTVARQMQRLQAATRRGEHAPVKKNRLDMSRSKLRGSGEDHAL